MDAVAALEIISAGPLTSVQDLGRSGYGRYGVAPSGALDPYALRIANLLVGNRAPIDKVVDKEVGMLPFVQGHGHGLRECLVEHGLIRTGR